jgi:hypothetical protein
MSQSPLPQYLTSTLVSKFSPPHTLSPFLVRVGVTATCTIPFPSPLCSPIQGDFGHVGQPGPPGEDGEKVSLEMS